MKIKIIRHFILLVASLEIYISLNGLVLLNFKGKVIIVLFISSIVLSVYSIVVSITFTFTFTFHRHNSVTVFSNRQRWRWSCVIIVVTSVHFVRFIQMVVNAVFDRWFLVLFDWSDSCSFQLKL